MLAGSGHLEAHTVPPKRYPEDIARIRTLTNRPFSINLFAGAYRSEIEVDASLMLNILRKIHTEWNLPEPVLPSLPCRSISRAT
jgi:hypothetical protein